MGAKDNTLQSLAVRLRLIEADGSPIAKKDVAVRVAAPPGRSRVVGYDFAHRGFLDKNVAVLVERDDKTGVFRVLDVEEF